MTIADDIIYGRKLNFSAYLSDGVALDDIDEYGFTPLIETAIARQVTTAQLLLDKGVRINKPDVTGRTALHWAVDNYDLEMVRLLLEHGANANAYTSAGLSILVYPVLRGQDDLKRLLYKHGAKLDFALDFILGKLIGHRFELTGDVDIVNADGEFIELDYEGFILEFTVAMIRDSLQRFTSSYSTRHLRDHFQKLYAIITAFNLSAELLSLQHQVRLTEKHHERLAAILQAPLLILPAASRGHALCFVRYGNWWAKIDRGENSITEGSVNIYRITKPEQLTAKFLHEFMLKKQDRRYFHNTINQQLGLQPILQVPMSSQIAGNCSWANVQGVIPVAYILQQASLADITALSHDAFTLYDTWAQWDQDRALDACIQRFYMASKVRQASLASMLAAVLFQACDASKDNHLARAEKILMVLTIPEYGYILKSYLDTYCVRRLTYKGNNLLKLLDDCGVNPNIGVNAIATGLPKHSNKKKK